jgi:hypothetical protein
VRVTLVKVWPGITLGHKLEVLKRGAADEYCYRKQPLYGESWRLESVTVNTPMMMHGHYGMKIALLLKFAASGTD